MDLLDDTIRSLDVGFDIRSAGMVYKPFPARRYRVRYDGSDGPAVAEGDWPTVARALEAAGYEVEDPDA